MSEIPKRITGNDTCFFDNGNLCDACCNLQRFEDPIFPNGKKPFNSPCVFLKKFSTDGGQGCGIRGSAPFGCNEYLCVYTDPTIQARMLANQYKEGKITREEALELGKFYAGMEVLVNLNKPSNE